MVIPIPNGEREYITGSDFLLSNDMGIIANEGLEFEVSYIQKFFAKLFHITVNKRDATIQGQNAVISLEKDKSRSLRDESYFLKITNDRISIIGSRRGIFYGIQTLILELLTSSISSKTPSLPSYQIEDSPRFQWRGFMLDEARHFQGKGIVKEILDCMSFLKLNKFHWHLSDDQGWRIVSDKFPRLTEIGSIRNKTQIGGFLSYLTRKKSNDIHSGAYSKEDIKEIVEYAAERNVEIIPEIDIPGHTSALIASYPELSCKQNKIEVSQTFGIKKDVVCPGKLHVYDFLDQLFEEVCSLFPSQFFHIGGDETPKSRWKSCQDCQDLINTENLKDEDDLQAYFMNKIGSMLKKRGKISVFWNDGLHTNLNSEFIGQYWLFKHEEVIKTINKGRLFIISRFFSLYLDYNYYLTPLKKSYTFEPVPSEVYPDRQNNILGIEAPLWTEWVRDRDRLYWQIFPRLIAIAETGWSNPNRKNYEDFKQRLLTYTHLLRFQNIPFANLNQADPGKFQRILRLFSHLRDPKMKFG